MYICTLVVRNVSMKEEGLHTYTGFTVYAVNYIYLCETRGKLFVIYGALCWAAHSISLQSVLEKCCLFSRKLLYFAFPTPRLLISRKSRSCFLSCFLGQDRVLFPFFLNLTFSLVASVFSFFFS